MLPLPGGFRLHQKVVALYELLLNSDMKVPLGSLLKTWTMSLMSGFSPMFLFFCAFLPSFWKFSAPTEQFPRLSWSHHWKPRGRQSYRPL